ncbi:cell surface protein [methanogenic archaeon mixed culture ISO4-G1]|nr:cell surface protein [methanogenic archaeon mixed culture ISO4-G1]
MNTKGTKFLAVLAVLAMAFAAFAVIASSDDNDAAATATYYVDQTNGNDVNAGTATAPLKKFATAIAKEDVSTIVFVGNYATANDDKVDMAGKAVTLKSADPANKSVITGDYVTFNGSARTMSGSVTLENLKITFTSDYLGWDGAAATTWTNVNLKIIGCEFVSGTPGDLIRLTGEDVCATGTIAVTIQDSMFTSLNTDDRTGIVVTGTPASLTVKNSVFNGFSRPIQTDATTIDIDGVTFNSNTTVKTDKPQINIKGAIENATVSVKNSSIQGILTKPMACIYGADSDVAGPSFKSFQVDGDVIINDDTANLITIPANGKFIVSEGTKFTMDSTATDKLVVADKGTLQIDGKMVLLNGAVVENNGTIIVPTAADAAMFDGNVKVAATDGSPEKTTDTSDIAANTDVTSEQINDVGADVVIFENAIASADVPAGKTIVITNAANLTELDVTKDNSAASVIAEAASFEVTTGTDQNVAVTDFTGTITFSKGSVVIVVDDWSAGTINLDKDTIAKIRGNVTGADVKILFTGTSGTAKVIVESGADKALTIGAGAKLTIGGSAAATKDKIDVEINGIVTGAGALDVQYAKSVTINDGAVVDVATFTNTSKAVTVYSGADINKTAFSAFDKIAGKDAGSGTWSYADNVLTLNNYNGTYNFRQIAGLATSIKLIGDSTITYAAPADLVNFSMFTALTTLTATVGSESLTINADISAVEDISVLNDFVVLDLGGNFKLEQVNLAITITGSNAKWTAEKIALADVVGMIVDGNLTVEGTASLSVDVLSALTTDAAEIKGVSVTGTTDIKSNSTFTVTAPANAFAAAGAFTVKFESTVTINGDMTSGISTNVNNKSSLTVSGLLTAAALGVTLESVVDFNDVVLSGASSNDVEMTVNGNMLIASGTFTNNGKLTNNGTILVIGNLTNNGTFDNNGTISVPANKIGTQGTAKTLTFTNNEYDQLGVNVAMIKQISLTTTAVLDGTGTVAVAAGDLMVFTKTVNGAPTEEAFTGTMVMTQDGTGYTIVLENAAKTTKITIVYDSTKATDAAHDQIGTDYSVSVTGKVTVAGDLYNLTANTYKKDHAGAVGGSLPADATIFAANTGTFSVAMGTFTNAGSVIVSANGATILVADATWNGPITANTALTIAGKFNGEILSNDGDIAVGAKAVIKGNITAVGNLDIDGTVTGNIDTKGTVSVDKKVTGDISTENEVTVTGELVGNVTITGASQFISTAGKMNGELTYNFAYLAKKGDAAKTEGSATMKIVGEATYTIALVAAVDASSDSVDGTAGFFRYATAPSAVDKDGIEFTLLAGTFDQNSSVVMPVGSSFVVETGTVFQIDKSFEFNVVDSALKISDSATANIDLGSDVPDYGTVVYVMSFTKTEGYTIYSNLAYALANADEGSVLTVGQSTVIKTSVEIGTGITVEVPKDIILTFQNDAGKSMNLSMKDGAKIELIDNGMVVFAASGDDTDDAELEAGDSFEYYSVSGTIVFGDNAVEFDGVRFTAESTVVGVAATETVPAKISTTLLYNEGTATIAAGVGTGSITLGNGDYLLVKGDDESKELVYATFIVGEGAVFDAVAINDAFARVNYDADKEVDEYTAYPTHVEINGILNLSANTIANGVWSGLGKVTLPENKTFTLPAYPAPVANGADMNAGSVASFVLVDTTEDENGYALEFATASDAGELTFTAKKVKLDGEDHYAMTVGGILGFGAIEATTAAVLDQLTIKEDAGVVADTTFLLKDKNSTARGYLMTNDIYMKAEGVTAYGALDYEVTFEQEGYTVYTYFASVDFEEITDITIEKEGFVFANGQVIEGDVTITIMDGVFAQVPAGGKLIIGEAATTLGAGAPVIVGSIWIPTNSYMIVYPNADITGAEILSQDKTTDATSSKFDIEGTLYATVYASKTAATTKTLANASADLVPKITGYTFTKWVAYNAVEGDGLDQLIGVTDVTATLVAGKVTITITAVEGVTYYMDGVEFLTTDLATKVTVGSVVTMKISDTSKYQGTPKIDGKTNYVVSGDSDGKTITATGVSPVEPEPEPAPAGMTLTEILLIVLVVLIAIMVVIIALRLNRS